MDIRQRLAIFCERLCAAPPAKNAEEAFALICRVLEEVEAEFCPVPPTNPAPTTFDGRMYVPQPDNIRMREDGSMWVKTLRHRISIQPDGTFTIFCLAGQRLIEEFRKMGAGR